MFNVLTLQVSFKLFIVLHAVRRFFCQFIDRIWLESGTVESHYFENSGNEK